KSAPEQESAGSATCGHCGRPFASLHCKIAAKGVVIRTRMFRTVSREIRDIMRSSSDTRELRRSSLFSASFRRPARLTGAPPTRARCDGTCAPLDQSLSYGRLRTCRLVAAAEAQRMLNAEM